MQSAYFLFFCLGIAYIIYWVMRHDDQADFNGEEKEQKFSPEKNKNKLDK